MDLLHLVEAIAHQRGLAPRIAMVTSWWASNYSNGGFLKRSRVCQQGSAVQPAPSDVSSERAGVLPAGHRQGRQDPTGSRQTLNRQHCCSGSTSSLRSDVEPEVHHIAVQESENES